jgi:hypothetical protein
LECDQICSRDIDHLRKNAVKKLLGLVWSQFMTSLILVHNGPPGSERRIVVPFSQSFGGETR